MLREAKSLTLKKRPRRIELLRFGAKGLEERQNRCIREEVELERRVIPTWLVWKSLLHTVL